MCLVTRRRIRDGSKGATFCFAAILKLKSEATDDGTARCTAAMDRVPIRRLSCCCSLSFFTQLLATGLSPQGDGGRGRCPGLLVASGGNENVWGNSIASAQAIFPNLAPDGPAFAALRVAIGQLGYADEVVIQANKKGWR